MFASLASHRTVTGTGRERALAALLRELLPRRYEVLSGAIALDGDTPRKATRQIDLMIVDTFNFPVLARDDDLAVVLPEAVLATVEVKSSASGKKAFKEIIQQVSAANAEATASRRWFSAVFSFDYPNSVADLAKRIGELVKERDDLQKQIDEKKLAGERLGEAKAVVSAYRADSLPDAIVVASGAFAIKAHEVDATSGESKQFFELYDAPDKSAAVVVLLTEILNYSLTQVTDEVGAKLVGRITKSHQLHEKYLQVTRKSANSAVSI